MRVLLYPVAWIIGDPSYEYTAESAETDDSNVVFPREQYVCTKIVGPL